MQADEIRAKVQGHILREPMRTGKPQRPRLRPWDGIHIAQVIKRYAQQRVIAVEQRIVQGAQAQVEALLQKTQDGGMINSNTTKALVAQWCT